MELIIGVGLAAALVWGLVWCVQGDLVLGALAVVIVGACLGHPFWKIELGPVPLTLDRILLAGLLTTYVVQWRLGRTDPKPIGAADRWLLGLLGLLTVSFLLTGFPPEKLGEGSAPWRLATGYLIPGLLYWSARQAPMEHRTVQRVWAVGRVAQAQDFRVGRSSSQLTPAQRLLHVSARTAITATGRARHDLLLVTALAAADAPAYVHSASSYDGLAFLPLRALLAGPGLGAV
ncbi:MAG TPA: hypothetical protein PK777_02835, partial [Thermoguttaceae bacterium]|nr:hypothetical protein [Thermoguttaceae bacterium]